MTRQGQGAIDAQVDIIEELGASRLCNLTFEDIPFCVLTEDRPDLAAGTTVGINLPPDRIHLFDSSTEKKIVAKLHPVSERQVEPKLA